VRDAVLAQVSDAAVVGTAAYMAPEQAVSPAVSPAADCYSVGVMLFEALTGRLPFEGRAIEILMNKQQVAAPPVARFGPAPADLARLCDELLALEPARRPTAADIVARLSTRPRPARPIARCRSSAAPTSWPALDAALDDVRRGEPRTVCIEGPSGIGKSALVHAFVERSTASTRRAGAVRALLRARVGAVQGHRRRGRRLVRELLRRDPIDVAFLLTPEVDALARTFPVLRRVPAIARLSVRKPDSPIELRARAFRGLRHLLSALAAQAPLVIVIDDVQWADSDSLALLGEVLEPSAAPPILLILTRRLAASAPPLALPCEIATMGLERLSAAEGRALVTLLAPERAADADALVDDADGHPLFLQQLVRHSAGAVARLDQALWAQVTRMEPASRRVLELVAVAGAPVPQGVIGGALELDRRALAKAIDTLRASWLVRTGGTRSHDPIEPYHDRVRDAVTARIPPARRRRYHRWLAAALLASPAVEQAPLLVVRHLEAAGALDHAAELAEVSAQRASDALAFELAADLWAAALRMGRHDDDRRRAILAARAEALGYAGRGHAAAQVYLAAAEGAEPEVAARCRRLAAHELLVSGHVVEGRRLLDEVLTAIGEYNPRSIGAAKRWLAWLWLRTLVRGTHFTPRRTPDAIVDRSAAARRLSHGVLGLGMVEVIAGGAFQARALLVALRLGDRRRVAYALAYHAMYLGSSGAGSPLARRAVARAAELARACTASSWWRGRAPPRASSSSSPAATPTRSPRWPRPRWRCASARSAPRRDQPRPACSSRSRCVATATTASWRCGSASTCATRTAAAIATPRPASSGRATWCGWPPTIRRARGPSWRPRSGRRPRPGCTCSTGSGCAACSSWRCTRTTPAAVAAAAREIRRSPGRRSPTSRRCAPRPVPARARRDRPRRRRRRARRSRPGPGARAVHPRVRAPGPGRDRGAADRPDRAARSRRRRGRRRRRRDAGHRRAGPPAAGAARRRRRGGRRGRSRAGGARRDQPGGVRADVRDLAYAAMTSAPSRHITRTSSRRTRAHAKSASSAVGVTGAAVGRSPHA
jgi:hypothetical protein